MYFQQQTQNLQAQSITDIQAKLKLYKQNLHKSWKLINFCDFFVGGKSHVFQKSHTFHTQKIGGNYLFWGVKFLKCPASGFLIIMDF